MRHLLQLSRIKSSLSSEWNLNDTEVETRRIEYGTNDIMEVRRNHWLDIAIDTIKDPMIWFLIITGFLFLILKNYNQALILFLSIIPLLGMDAFLHWRTQTSTQSLSSHLSSRAVVIRNNKEINIASWEIVPGDLVVIAENNLFPADGIIIAGHNLQVDESVLTGESFPVKKENLSFLQEGISEPFIDSNYWGFAGTRLLTGRALVRIVYTGEKTLYGEIIRSALLTSQTRTPLQISISKLVFSLIIAASILCVILAFVRYSQGFGLLDAILSAAMLAVAALPDEFPVVFTFFLGVGVYHLAKKKALVRRAVSVENIGRVSVICTDKTGTITEGQLQLARYIPNKNITDNDLLQSAAIASRIESGDLLDLAINNEIKFRNFILPQRIITFPFTEDRKRESSIISFDNDKWLIASKGAPETIISISSLSDDEKDFWLDKITELAASGYKVIACAQKVIDAAPVKTEPTSNYDFIGLLAFTDPPRKEVFDAIQTCKKNKIHVLMITGDHPETARSIAKEIGLGENDPKILLGHDIKFYIENNGAEALRDIDVIARATPSQKFDIVQALQSINEIVAVTGDGVNDVPALKASDIGIAMGERGTQSAREVSDIILLDDNFSSIVNAISEGRQLFKNLQSSFKYLLMIHMPFVLSAAIIPLLGFPLLYLPIHLVFIELIIHPTAMLVFQDMPPENHLEIVKTKKHQLQFFSAFEWFKIIGIGLFSTLVVILSFIFTVHYNVEHARALVIAELCITSAAITVGLSGFKTKITKIISICTLLAGIIVVQTPMITKLFSMTPLHIHDWLIIISTGLVTYLLMKFSRKTIEQ